MSNSTMDKRKLTVVKMETPAFPEADLSYAAYPDGSTAIGAAPTKDQEERVKRWNAYPELIEALSECSAELFAQAADQKRAMHHVTEARALLNTLKTQ